MLLQVIPLISLIFAVNFQPEPIVMQEVSVPTTKKIPKQLEIHGDVRIDDYYWLRDRENPEVIEYLEAENAYYKAMTAHTDKFQEALFHELKSRIKEDDSSVPYKHNGYWYVTRYETGKEYPIFSRKKESLEAPEEIMFDVNRYAEPHDYYNLKGITVSPDNRLAAYGEDTVSRRQYTIRIKNLVTGETYPEEIENTTGNAVWAKDNRTMFYTRKDPETLRSDKVYRHILGTPVSDDVLVYEEKDPTFYAYAYKSKSRDFIIIGSSSTMTSEYRFLDAANPMDEFKIFSPRERGVEYNIFHYWDNFYILTNKDGATNFKIMRTDLKNTESGYWEEFIPHREQVLLEDFEIFRNFYVLGERDQGLNKLKVVSWDGTIDYYLPFESETFVAYGYINPDFETEKFRYVYNSMTSPYSIRDLDMRTREEEILKKQEVLDPDFDEDNYRSRRVWATARDGKRIPISMVYHKDTEFSEDTPLLQYAYGSYGHTTDPYFSSIRLSLLNRGFIYAIAHVRGGEYLGRQWYEEGRLLKKKNTFTDFIDCSKFLISEGYTSAKHLYAYGGSAGGLLMGAIINIEPKLYNGVIAAVPFVDVVTTMLDESIPLTTGEYDEWGNPNDPEYYEYIKSYSPYDNVTQQEYPHLLVTTGLHDSQVQYWEPAKWVAKLREYKKGDQKLFLETNMETGHGGASGRFEALKETAREYSFLLDLEGKI